MNRKQKRAKQLKAQAHTKNQANVKSCQYEEKRSKEIDMDCINTSSLSYGVIS